MSRQSLRAALVRLTSFETTPPYDAAVDVGRELNDVRTVEKRLLRRKLEAAVHPNGSRFRPKKEEAGASG
jgi:hypothetical protein